MRHTMSQGPGWALTHSGQDCNPHLQLYTNAVCLLFFNSRLVLFWVPASRWRQTLDAATPGVHIQCANTVGPLGETSQPPAFPPRRHLLRCPVSLVPLISLEAALWSPRLQSACHVKSRLSLLFGRLEAQNPLCCFQATLGCTGLCKDLLMLLPASHVWSWVPDLSILYKPFSTTSVLLNLMQAVLRVTALDLSISIASLGADIPRTQIPSHLQNLWVWVSTHSPSHCLRAELFTFHQIPSPNAHIHTPRRGQVLWSIYRTSLPQFLYLWNGDKNQKPECLYKC